MDTVSVNPNRRRVGNTSPCVLHEAGKVEEELEGFIRVYRNGSVERFSQVVSNVPPSEKPTETVASRDVVIDAATRVWVRLYLPAEHRRRNGKLPVVIYFHGGGFVMGSPAWSIYHTFMCRLASEINSVIISVAYRLAPENRLPAAYDDCFGAVEWVRQQAAGSRTVQAANNPKEAEESWLRSYCDFSRCFLAGDSAGGNIAHHVAMRASKRDVKPLLIRGAIIIQPFFGGENRSAWERETCDPALPQKWIDVFWKLSLPVGASRDHPSCSVPDSSTLQDILLPPILLCISERDVMRERNLNYYEALRRAGKNVRQVIFKDVGHAFQLLQPQAPRIHELTRDIREFINKYL